MAATAQAPVAVGGALLRKGQKVRVKVSRFIMQAKGWQTREFVAEIEAVSAKAILISGVGSAARSETCHRCGRFINHPVSVHFGLGVDCLAEVLGIDRDSFKLTEADIDAIRARITVATRIEKQWVPVNSSEIEVLADAPAAPAAPAARPGMAPARPVTLAQATVTGDRIAVRAPFSYKDELKGVPGARWDKDAKAWTYPATPAAAKGLAVVFGDKLGLDAATEALMAQARRQDAAAAHKTADELADVPVTKFPAWLHQRRAFHFAKEQVAAMLAMDMGTGKTKVATDLVCNSDDRLVLVVCPKKAVDNVWVKQLPMHAGRPVVVLGLGGGESVAKRTEMAKQAVATARAAGRTLLIITNYDSIWREPFATWAKGIAWDRVILDESHRIKAPGGRASMYCGELSKSARRRLCLSGTPMPHSPLDVYAQYRFLEPGVFGTNFGKFRARYAVMGGFGGKEVRGYQNEDELNTKFYSIGYRVTKDILDLPEFNHIERPFALTGGGAKLYRQLVDDFTAEVEGGEVTASNALTKLLRLQQVTSGFVKNDEGEEVQVDTGKADELADVLEDLDPKEPVVVFARFHHDLDTIRKVAEDQGRRFGEVSGRRDDLAAWDADKVDVLAVQINAGGEGIDLTRAAYAIYYSLGFSLKDYLQSLARIHRPGQKRATTFIHLIAEGTVDRKVYAALAERKEVVDSILAEIRGGN